MLTDEEINSIYKRHHEKAMETFRNLRLSDEETLALWVNMTSWANHMLDREQMIEVVKQSSRSTPEGDVAAAITDDDKETLRRFSGLADRRLVLATVDSDGELFRYVTHLSITQYQVEQKIILWLGRQEFDVKFDEGTLRGRLVMVPVAPEE